MSGRNAGLAGVSGAFRRHRGSIRSALQPHHTGHDRGAGRHRLCRPVGRTAAARAPHCPRGQPLRLDTEPEHRLEGPPAAHRCPRRSDRLAVGIGSGDGRRRASDGWATTPAAQGLPAGRYADRSADASSRARRKHLAPTGKPDRPDQEQPRVRVHPGWPHVSAKSAGNGRSIRFPRHSRGWGCRSSASSSKRTTAGQYRSRHRERSGGRAPYDGEVILADSASTDRTVEIAARYPITVVELGHPDRRCCGLGPQLGFQHSSGDYVYILDGDMQLDAAFIPKAIACMEREATWRASAARCADARPNTEFAAASIA